MKILFSPFTFLRNSKAVWYVHFMIIRHKREKDKAAEGKSSRGGKTKWTQVGKCVKI